MRWLLLLLTLCPAATPAFDLPVKWPHGRAGEPSLQVHEAAPGFWVLRQSKRSHFEAPFMYLVAGAERAVLLDTGALPEQGEPLPLRTTIDALLAGWAAAHGRRDWPLLVLHSHAHADHRGGDAQFADRANTEIVPADASALMRRFALSDWPRGEAAIELGTRRLILLPLPGHEPAHIALFDPQTRTILSGDSLYPGLITIRDRAAFRASIERLQRFAEHHAAERLLGAHVEMSAKAGVLYPLGSREQPDEHALPMTLQHLREMHAALSEAGDFRHELIHADFALTQVLPPAAEPPAQHGMLLLGRQRLWISHLPMFHAPHDYQAIAEVSLEAAALQAYRADLAAHPSSQYTLAPTQDWVLPEVLKPGSSFRANLYRGHFERGGSMLMADLEVRVEALVHLRRFEPDDADAGDGWIAFGHGSEQFLAHRISRAPDFDQVVATTAVTDRGDGLRRGPQTPLAVGQSIDGSRVERVIYAEFGDLR